jgi:aryl-alcohol dehydrogenase-like predicted oxidoreductase
VDHGINVIDTAPVYGFGRSEEIVGKAIAEGRLRSRVLIATKAGLERRDGKVFRNSSRDRINHEIEQSLQRLRTDHVDIYQSTGQTRLPRSKKPRRQCTRSTRKIRAIGVSNFSIDQIERFRRFAPIHVLQPPYNLFEREIEAEILPYCRKNEIATFGYGALCRGLLSGRMQPDTIFSGDDLRREDPKIRQPRFGQYLAPCNGSIVSPSNISANASFTWRSAGCSIKASPRPFGAHAIPVNWSRSTSYSAGRSMLPSKPRSTGS